MVAAGAIGYTPPGISRDRKMTIRMLLAAMLVLPSACATTTQTPRVDPQGKPSFDGLMPLEGVTMSKVWAREDLDLRGYTKFMTVGAGLKYRPVKGSPSTARRSSSSTFPLDDAQKDRIQKIVSEEFQKALATVTSMELVEKPGPGVLIVRGGIIDIVSRVPPEQAGRVDFYLDSVGFATFVIELIDAESGGVLLRGIDSRAAQTPGYTYRSNRATNASEVRRLAAHWARLLASRLNEIKTLAVLND